MPASQDDSPPSPFTPQPQSEPAVPASLVRMALRLFAPVAAVVSLVSLVARHYPQAVLGAVGAVGYLLLAALLERLGPRLAGACATLLYFALAASAMAAGTGVRDVAIVLLPTGMVLGAVLLGPAWRTWLLVTPVLIVGLVGWLHASSPSPIPSAPRDELLAALVAALLLLALGALSFLLLGRLQDLHAERERSNDSLRQSSRELEWRREALQLVADLAHRLHGAKSVEAIAATTVDELVHLSQSPFVAFYLYEPEHARLRMIADHGFTAEERQLGLEIPLEGSLSGQAVRSRQVVTSADLGHDARVWPPVGQALAKRGAAATLCLPMVFGEQVFGTVNLIYSEGRSFTPVDLDTFQTVGQSVSLALANIRHVAGLEHMAFHDSLTALPNRSALHRRLGEVLAAATPRFTALALLDLVRFRDINDTLGHHAGDEVIVQVGRRLAAELPRSRAGARGELFRLGGDEYVALFPELADPAEGELLARQLLAALGSPFAAAGMALEIGASAGLAVAPPDGNNGHDLLRCADVALYRAKLQGGGVVRYEIAHDEHTPERLAMLSDLGRAIRDGQLTLYYQPIVALASGAVVGYEALVRWPHPRLGLLLPRQFLPLVEGNEVIHPLTYWVVETALAQQQQWQAARPGLSMAINLSPRLLLDRNCPQRLEEVIRRVGADPALVVFELTETAIVTDPEASSTMLGRIVSTGARLAIDDFGTGYSSLTYLKRFPVHTIKIDRSFVNDLPLGGQSLAIVRSTVELAHTLGLRVVAEGVETREVAERLRAIGCDLAQGYFFSPPVPASGIDPRSSSLGAAAS